MSELQLKERREGMKENKITVTLHWTSWEETEKVKPFDIINKTFIYTDDHVLLYIYSLYQLNS